MPQIALGNLLDEIKAGARNLYQEHEQNRLICERSEILYRKWNSVFQKAGAQGRVAAVARCR